MFCLFKSFKGLMSNVTRKRMSMHVLAMMFALSAEGVKVETKYCTKNPWYNISCRLSNKEGGIIHEFDSSFLFKESVLY